MFKHEKLPSFMPADFPLCRLPQELPISSMAKTACCIFCAGERYKLLHHYHLTHGLRGLDASDTAASDVVHSLQNHIQENSANCKRSVATQVLGSATCTQLTYPGISRLEGNFQRRAPLPFGLFGGLHAPQRLSGPDQRAVLRYQIQRIEAGRGGPQIADPREAGSERGRTEGAPASKRHRKDSSQSREQAKLEAAVEAEQESMAADQGGKADRPKPAKRKRLNDLPPKTTELRQIIITAAKTQNPALAIQAYDESVALGLELSADSYKSVLYLTAGGDSWLEPYQHLPVPWPQEAKKRSPAGDVNREHIEVDAKELIRKGQELIGRLKSPCEMCYTSLARIAAAAGDADGAYHAAEEGQKADMPTRLRMFFPSLVAYASKQDTAGAFKVLEALNAAKVDLTESEYALLALACCGNATREQAWRVLGLYSRELTTLTEATIKAAEQLFRSKAASGWLPAGQKWVIEPCTISQSGVASTCGGQLEALDLEGDEWDHFAEGIAKLAAANEKKPNHFISFQAWLEEHGPYSVIIDGANVAFWGQSFEHGQFQFSQIGDVVETVRAAMPDQKPLVILHKGRLQGPLAATHEAQELITNLCEGNMLYSSPFGSNDDWYWIFATVKAGPDAKLISNDKMRDHIFQLLAPKYFHKWKQRHQVTYNFYGNQLDLHRPRIFTTCTQYLNTGSWVFPKAGTEEWTCIRPVKE